MRILVIGGSRFVGRHAVAAARAAGHEVTLFNRGLTAAPPAGTHHVRGDRDVPADLTPLSAGPWDAVLDCCAYTSTQVSRLADAVAAVTGRYLLVSSISVYGGSDPVIPPGVTEDDPVVAPVHGAGTGRAEDYGARKVACEHLAAERFAASTVVRPGLVVGPDDHTGRFSYWVDRLAAGGQVLAPGDPQAPAQVVDVRDLGAFAVRLLQDDVDGTFNVVAPHQPFEQLLTRIGQAVGSTGELVWVDEATLVAADVAPWTDLPLWLPARGAGMLAVRPDRALAAGFRPRPIGDTAADLLAWLRAEPEAPVTGLDRAREAALLAELTA